MESATAGVEAAKLELALRAVSLSELLCTSSVPVANS